MIVCKMLGIIFHSQNLSFLVVSNDNLGIFISHDDNDNENAKDVDTNLHNLIAFVYKETQLRNVNIKGKSTLRILPKVVMFTEKITTRN